MQAQLISHRRSHPQASQQGRFEEWGERDRKDKFRLEEGHKTSANIQQSWGKNTTDRVEPGAVTGQACDSATCVATSIYRARTWSIARANNGMM